MPRKPNPNAEPQMIYRAKTEEEKIKLKAFKEICARNGIEMRDVTAAGIDRFLREHNWPPGNSQTLLQVFGVEGKKFCGFCGAETDKLYDCLFISGLRKLVCEHCKNEAKERTTLSHVYGIQ